MPSAELRGVTLDCDDPQALAGFYLELSGGATQPEHQPGGDGYRVLLDPAGHPFCLLAP